jgi:hypothetical protein
MKSLKTSAIGAVLVSALFFAAFTKSCAASKSNAESDPSENSFAVLELFTSEGCSSCPAADDLLARIQQNAGDKPIFVLAYHVDYWDNLGWKDPFSSAAFTKRQYEYSRQFAGQVYTPQVIINGKTECIGSDEPALSGAIKDAFSQSAPVTLTLQTETQGDKIKLNYEINGSPKGSKLLVALVQKRTVSKVARGENAGRTLYHAQVVRNLSSFNLKNSKNGTELVSIPADYNAADWEVIGFIQDSQTGVIKGATRGSSNAAPAGL